jgi:hypothetical protein
MRTYLDLLSNEYDEMAHKIKRLSDDKARVNLIELHVLGQRRLIQALILQDQGEVKEMNEAIDEAEDRLHALKTLVKHHINKEIWDDENL